MKTYYEFINEAALPHTGKEMWKKIMEILPELKTGKWVNPTRITNHDSTPLVIWEFEIPYNTVAGKWEIRLPSWTGYLADVQMIMHDGITIYDSNGEEIEETKDPMIVAKILNKKKTEDWIVNNRKKDWEKIVGKKYGI